MGMTSPQLDLLHLMIVCASWTGGELRGGRDSNSCLAQCLSWLGTGQLDSKQYSERMGKGTRSRHENWISSGQQERMEENTQAKKQNGKRACGSGSHT